MSASDINTTGRALRQVDDPATKRVLEAILSNIDIIKKSVDKLENPGDSEWFDLELQNGWVQYGSQFYNPQYSVSKKGIVRIHALIKNGTTTSGTVLFKLPSGARPSERLLINIQSDGALGRIDILPSGDVLLMTGITGWVSLDNISFQAYR